MKAFADTSYLLALVVRSDPLHHRALAWHERTIEPIITTEFVLIELGDALCAPHQRVRLTAAVASLRRQANVIIVPASTALLDAGLTLFAARPDKAWSLTDCTSFEVMRDHGLLLALTYDHHFEQAGFDPLLRRDPVA